MQGSIRQRGNHSYQLRVHVGIDPLTGKHRYIARTVHGTKREAQRALAALVAECDEFVPRSTKGATVATLLHEWLEHARPGFSPRTVVVTHEMIENAIIPNLGGVLVAKLTPVDIDRFYDRLRTVGGPRGPYAPATIRRIHGVLRRALSQGVRWGWIRQNPAVDASPPSVPFAKINAVQPAVVSRLFQQAQNSNSALATFIALAASTGARRGELLALRWGDVDIQGGKVKIERGIVIAGNEIIEQGTKTHQSRTVAIDQVTSKLLWQHHQEMSERASKVGTAIGSNGFVFSDSLSCDAPWRPDSTSRAFRVLCQKLGVKGIRLHDLQHYVATHLLGAGVDVRTVAGRLGHRNASTTLNVYSHFLPEADREAAERLGELLAGVDSTKVS